MERDSFERDDSEERIKQERNENRTCEIAYRPLPKFTLMVVNEFR